ncbi:MAG: nicotinamide-nucleotide amidohydrolase family protein [Oscillospiraceae bacterium]|nr:nicotinamide-nucleotide amidohydrolase family protein [Oscillospiraceae bacterium]
MIGEFIHIGGEVRGNAQFLGRQMLTLGIEAPFSMYAEANPDAVRAALANALTRSEVILIVGGIGPDGAVMVRSTVCAVLGLEMARHEKTRLRMEKFCADSSIPLSSSMLAASDIPKGSAVLENDVGIIPGCVLRSQKKCIAMLPAPSAEMFPMVKKHLVPFLSDQLGVPRFSREINVFYPGVTLFDVEKRIEPLFVSQNPKIQCFETGGEVRVRVTAFTPSREMAEAMTAPFVKRVADVFGSGAYGVDVDGLENVVVMRLRQNNMTLATAESCTGGLISKRITDLPGASDVFAMGVTAYANAQKISMLGVPKELLVNYGAVSPQVAAAMAVGARMRAGSDLAVSTTGIAGPGGGSQEKPVGLVYIALSDRRRVWVRKAQICKPGQGRGYVRQMAASHALDLVREYLVSLPRVMPGVELLK